MTLKTRNRIFFALGITGAAVFLLLTVLLVWAKASGLIIPPDSPRRIAVPLKNLPFCKYNFEASLVSVMAISLAAPVLSLLIARAFEKTSSLEVLFLSGAIVGFGLEAVRAMLPINGLWSTYSILLVAVTRTVIAGRALVVLSIFFGVVFSGQDQRQNVERNLLILAILSVSIGITYPVTTLGTTSCLTELWAFGKLFLWVRIAIFMVSVISILVNAYVSGIMEKCFTALGLVILAAGYSFLVSGDCWVNLGIGLVLVAAGASLYLSCLHHLQNTWN